MRRLGNFWKRRSKKGKAGIIIGALFVVLLLIPTPDVPPATTTTTQAVAVSTTVAPTTTTTVAPTTTTAAPTTTTSPQTTTVTTPSQDPAAVAYVNALQPLLVSVASSLSDIGELAPLWPGWTDDATMRFIIALGNMQAMEAQAQALSPPPSMQPIHAKVLDAAGHMKKASQLIARGIDNVDADTINEGTAEMLEGNAAIQEATALFTSLN